MSKRVLLVVGTRPEAIKLAPVAAALGEYGIAPLLLLTGQHPDLDPAAYGLGGHPEQRLDVPANDDPYAHAAAVAAAIGPRLDPADMVVVQGDTSSALGGALAGFERGAGVAHVEAGLRSFDSAMPWPEEDNRIAIDARADLLFAPTAVSAANLRAERAPGAIHVTGNTGIDALLATLAALPPPAPRDQAAPPRLLVTCHRRENWGAGLTSVALALIELARGGELAVDVVLHPNPRVAGSLHRLLGHAAGVRLIDPLGHAAMIAAMRGAWAILSDSGGVQEEAPALGVPLLVLRDKTERPEGVASGNMALVGTGSGRIVIAVRRLVTDADAYTAMARPALPFGDGKSGPRIAALIAAAVD